jgi:hypothetical protein
MEYPSECFVCNCTFVLFLAIVLSPAYTKGSPISYAHEYQCLVFAKHIQIIPFRPLAYNFCHRRRPIIEAIVAKINNDHLIFLLDLSFFSLYVSGEPADHFSQFSPLLPFTEVSQPTGKCHPRWQPTRRLAVSCGLGRHQIWARDCRTTVWHATIELPRLPHWATTPPSLSYHASLIELPRLPHWATTPLGSLPPVDQKP